jgi:hypothetical protein
MHKWVTREIKRTYRSAKVSINGQQRPGGNGGDVSITWGYTVDICENCGLEKETVNLYHFQGHRWLSEPDCEEVMMRKALS